MRKLSVYLFFLSALLFSACQKNIKSSDCKIKTTFVKPLHFNSGYLNFDIPDISYMQTSYENEPVLIAGRIVTAKDFIKLNDFANEITGLAINSISILFYIEGNPSTLNGITKENVKGISFFSKSGKMYRHRFFLQDQRQLKELPELDIETYGLFLPSELYMNKYIANAQASSSFTLSFSNSEADFPKNKVAIDLLEKKARKYVAAKNSYGLITDDEMLDDPSGGNCNACLIQANGTCERIPGTMPSEYPFRCAVKLCGGSQVEQTLREDGRYGTDSLSLTFKDQLHYTFRDSLLNNTSFGRRYIRYYYDLSSIYSDKYSFGLMFSASRTLFKYNSLIESLITTSSSENQQFLSTQLKNELLNLIISFKAVYNDSYTEDIFYQIIQDINSIGTKTTDQVRQEYFGL